jgi:hypothetical protein
VKRTDRIVKKPKLKTGSGNRVKAKQNRTPKLVAELPGVIAKNNFRMDRRDFAFRRGERRRRYLKDLGCACRQSLGVKDPWLLPSFESLWFRSFVAQLAEPIAGIAFASRLAPKPNPARHSGNYFRQSL